MNSCNDKDDDLLICRFFFIMEIWKDIKGYEKLYKVSNTGRVKSLKRSVCKNNCFYLKDEMLLKPSLNNSGYLRVNLYKNGNSKSFTVHSLVSMSFLNHKPNGTNEIVIDHINEIKTDNRLINLRLITNRENVSRNKKGTSNYTGVHWHKTQKKWCANIFVSGKKKYLGSFDSEIKAHLAYKEALKKI